jgi:hypothetical protein
VLMHRSPALAPFIAGLLGAPAPTAAAMPGQVAAAAATPAAAPALPGRHADPLLDSWAVSQAHVPDAAPPAPQVRTLGVTQLVIPKRAPDCDMELNTLAAPTGEPWPPASGPVDGFPVANQGTDMQIVLDNGANGSPVLVKIVDLERQAIVRHLYVLPNQSLNVDNLAAGKYEVRYQNIDIGGSKDDCIRKPRPAALVQAGEL